MHIHSVLLTMQSPKLGEELMMKIKNYLFLSVVIFVLSSCNASEQYDYSIENSWRPETTAYIHNCDWIRQSNKYNCGPASLVMVAAYLNDFTPSRNDLDMLGLWLDQNIDPWISLEGTSSNELVEASEKYYQIPAAVFNESYTIDKMYSDLENGLPLIVGIPSQSDRVDDILEESDIRHWVVVVGISPTHIYVNDPWSYEDMGRGRKFTIDSFLKNWLKIGVRFFPE